MLSFSIVSSIALLIKPFRLSPFCDVHYLSLPTEADMYRSAFSFVRDSLVKNMNEANEVAKELYEINEQNRKKDCFLRSSNSVDESLF